MNWTMVTLRGASVPVLLLGGGLVVALLMRNFDALALGAGVYADRVFYAGLATSLTAWAIFYSRLMRWERGTWHSCRHCGGPLGWMRMGRVYYGKQLDDFRRCYNCGRATPHHDQ